MPQDFNNNPKPQPEDALAKKVKKLPNNRKNTTIPSLENISCTSLKQNLSSILERILIQKQSFCITRKNHSDVVMLSREEYERLLEAAGKEEE